MTKTCLFTVSDHICQFFFLNPRKTIYYPCLGHENNLTSCLSSIQHTSQVCVSRQHTHTLAMHFPPTRSSHQCRISVTQVTVKAHGPLFYVVFKSIAISILIWKSLLCENIFFSIFVGLMFIHSICKFFYVLYNIYVKMTTVRYNKWKFMLTKKVKNPKICKINFIAHFPFAFYTTTKKSDMYISQFLWTFQLDGQKYKIYQNEQHLTPEMLIKLDHNFAGWLTVRLT